MLSAISKRESVLCELGDKTFSHILNHRRNIHGLTYNQANMVARGERKRCSNNPTRPRRPYPYAHCTYIVVRIRGHLESKKHGLKKETPEYTKMHDRYYEKVTSSIKQSLIKNKRSVAFHQHTFQDFLEDPLRLGQTKETSLITYKTVLRTFSITGTEENIREMTADVLGTQL